EPSELDDSLVELLSLSPILSAAWSTAVEALSRLVAVSDAASFAALAAASAVFSEHPARARPAARATMAMRMRKFSPMECDSSRHNGGGRAGFLNRHVGAQFGQPHFGRGVARRAPVAARAQRAAARDLGPVGNRAALELAEGEEPQQEAFEPLADRGEVV